MPILKSLVPTALLAIMAGAFAQDVLPPASPSTVQTPDPSADALPSAAAGAQASASEGASARRRRNARTGNLDDRVKLLAAELNLDAAQQTGVRRALIDEREQTLRVWSDTAVPAPIRIKATQGVADRTAARIRALLNEQQREKYIKPRPGELAPARTSGELQTWIDGTSRSTSDMGQQ